MNTAIQTGFLVVLPASSIRSSLPRSVPLVKEHLKPREWNLTRDLHRPDELHEGVPAALDHMMRMLSSAIQKLLEQANVKLSSVASNTLGVSGQQMIEAIIAGEEDPERLADLAQRRLRQRIPELQLALQGRVRDHHRFLLKEFLEEWRALGTRITSGYGAPCARQLGQRRAAG